MRQDQTVDSETVETGDFWLKTQHLKSSSSLSMYSFSSSFLKTINIFLLDLGFDLV